MLGKESLFFVSDEICQITSERLNQFIGLLAGHRTPISSKPVSFLNLAKITAAVLSYWDCTFLGHLDFFLYELPIHILSPFLYLEATFKHQNQKTNQQTKTNSERSFSNATLEDHQKEIILKRYTIIIQAFKDPIKIGKFIWDSFTTYYTIL